MNTPTHLSANTNIAGSRKTLNLIDRINDKANSKQKYIYATQAKSVCDFVYKRIEGVKRKINSDEKIAKGERYVDHLMSTVAGGLYRVIVTTHTTLLNLLLCDASTLGLERYNLIIDEKPNFYSVSTLQLDSDDLAGLDYWLDRTDCGDYYNFTVSSSRLEKALHKIANGGPIKSILLSALSSGFDTIMHKDCYKRVSRALIEPCSAYFISVISASVLSRFKSIELLSAFFDITADYILLNKTGFDVAISSELKTHSIDFPVSVYYVSDDDFNADMRDKTDLMQNYKATIETRHLNEPLLVLTNNDYMKLWKNNPLAEKPDSINGSNKYKHYTIAASFISVNADTFITNALDDFGIDKGIIHRERNVLYNYQFICRTAVRCDENIRHCYIYVIDKRSADFIADKFGIKAEKLKIEDVKPVKTSKKEQAKRNEESDFISRFKTRHYCTSSNRWRNDTKPQKANIKRYNDIVTQDRYKNDKTKPLYVIKGKR